ncbi:MFS transporter [Streptomyces litchfieldiae]|uniref:MFS transporter n=1 Tax=Streptomyces litchfieldiae TaxID=3075543 RepID=A0ABU2MM95_9ACTN|nr:MFS transporter [Streptomyces sp. DSM 44938]MDT0342724.1 MFS transporter [Streptomyces sp. DSM 44938]
MTTTSTLPAAGRDTGGGSPRRAGWLLAIVLTGQFMALLDIFIVNVAAPTVQADLAASGGELQLIIAGYTIAYAVLLITGARLGGRYGHGRLFLAGLVVFTAASLACGLAVNSGQLIAFRFGQGIGSALMLPQVLSLIQRTFHGTARARALTIFAAVLATGAAAGQIVGGVLIEANLFDWGWRPVFLVNVPIGALLLAVGLRVVPLDRPGGAERARGLDLPGLAVLTAAVLALTVPLVVGQEEDWPLWCWLSLAAGAVLVALFAWYESRLARRGGTPLISPRVLRSPGMTAAASRIFLAMAVNGGILFVLSLHLQGAEEAEGLGHGALRTGLMFIPTAVGFGATSLLWRRIPARRHGALAPAGFVLSAAAMLWMGLLLRDGGSGGPALLVAFALNGCALALAYSPTLTRSLALVAPADAADASGVTAMMTQLGMLVGVAALGTLFLNRAESELSTAEGVWAAMLGLAATALAGATAGVVGRARAR